MTPPYAAVSFRVKVALTAEEAAAYESTDGRAEATVEDAIFERARDALLNSDPSIEEVVDDIVL